MAAVDLTKQNLLSVATPMADVQNATDINAPYPFNVWVQTRAGIIPDQELQQYNVYLQNWYQTRAITQVSYRESIQARYLNTLKQLQVFFSKEEAESWYNNIDITSEKEVLLAIPYFAKKLKDIAIYYLKLRNKIKSTKIKYNLIGTSVGLEAQLREGFLDIFCKDVGSSVTLPAQLWNVAPELTAVRDTITFQVKEFYDDQIYADRSPTIALTSYVIPDDQTLLFLNSKGIVTTPLSSVDWLYDLGTLPTELVEQLSAAAIFDTGVTSSTVYNDLVAKYIGTPIQSVNYTPLSAQSYTYTLNFEVGDNSFFWPSGALAIESQDLPRLASLPLTASNFQTLGTAGSTIDTSDVIIIKYGDVIAGAWLNSIGATTQTVGMSSVLNAAQITTFRYPFPGRGLSATDIEWTGMSTVFNNEVLYLDEASKAAVEQAYWTASVPATSVNPIYLNQSTLIENGNASTQYKGGDELLNHSAVTTQNATFAGTASSAWLFRVDETNLPISSGTQTAIYWPYTTVDPEQTYPPYLPDSDQACDSTPISACSTYGATAGANISAADVVYKIHLYTDKAEDATEAAWLSGAGVANGHISYVQSTGFSLSSIAGEYTRFLWNGPATDVSNVFPSGMHLSNCKYVTQQNKYKDYAQCTCRRVNLMPFGQPGSQYAYDSTLADVIYQDTNPLVPFNPGSNTNSVWFRTNNDIGWGDGAWSNTLSLTPGNVYVYYRASIPGVENFPPLVTRYAHAPGTGSVKWVKAVKGYDNNWTSADKPSDLVITSGSMLLYDRKASSEFTTSLIVSSTDPYATNIGSLWSSYDLVTVNYNLPITLAYPFTQYSPALSAQIPTLAPTSIYSYTWAITDPHNNVTIYNSPTPSFTAYYEGLYTVAVSAFTSITAVTAITFSNIIPPITAVTVVQTLSSNTVEVPVPGFCWTTPLYGWNYSRKMVQTSTLGAKPYWAAVTVEDGVRRGGATQLVDDNILVNQPAISPISLEYNTYLEYTNRGSKVLWNQPLLASVNSKAQEWKSLQIVLTSNSIQGISVDAEYLMQQDTTSSLFLTNTIDTYPVEVMYHAVSALSVTHTVTAADPLIRPATVEFSATTITNRFYPTIAITPTFTNITPVDDYFSTDHLGALTYVDENYKLTSNATLTGGTVVGNIFTPGGRGLAREDQLNAYVVEEDARWLKEPITTNAIAGTIKKGIFREYQEFVPYEVSNANNIQGLITPFSRQTPWGGVKDAVWTDVKNFPSSFVGEYSTDLWANSQVLKNSGLAIDSWTTDIYGNQYGLYKNLTGVHSTFYRDVPGALWTRKVSHTVTPNALSAVFAPYALASAVYINLTGSGINHIEVFYDTMYIETSSAVILEKLVYDYDTDQISSSVNLSRQISLQLPTHTGLSTTLSAMQDVVVFLPTSAVDLQTNLVAYWNLDELSGTRVDLAGSYTLDANVPSISSAPGVYGNSALFTGTKYLTGSLDLSVYPAFSVSLWAKAPLAAPQSPGSPFYTGTYSDNNGALGFYLFNDEGLYRCDGFFGSTQLTGIATPNTWTNLVLTYDSVSATGSYYQDGVLKGTCPASGLVAPGIYVGTNPDWAAYNVALKGQVDSLGIWSRALSQTDVTALYNSGSGVDGAYRSVLTIIDSDVLLGYKSQDISYYQSILTYSAAPRGLYALPGESWLFPQQKQVILSFNTVLSSNLFPELYAYNINTAALKRIFPVQDIDALGIQGLSSIGATEITRNSITYNYEDKKFLFSFTALTTAQPVIIEIDINYNIAASLGDIRVYGAASSSSEALLPVMTSSKLVRVPALSSFAYTLSSTPAAKYQLQTPYNVQLNSSGLLTGQLTAGIYDLAVQLSTAAGSVYNNVTLSAV